ncbi:hypothetical protein C8R46DRAFT_1206266 [Mycena filopes]|nr:hypothetical protein C8R46DRAFT_1206266 [Mycena filopes]
MATFRISTTITASKRSSKRLSIASIASLASLASSSGSVCMTDSDNPIVVTTTVSTTSAPYPYPAPVPPPFTTSRGSDDLLPPPRHGAPPVAPAQTAEERAKQQKRRLSILGFAVGRKPEAPALNPALCEGWWCVFIFFHCEAYIDLMMQITHAAAFCLGYDPRTRVFAQPV